MKSFSVRPLTRLAEKIYMMLYMEESEVDGPKKISTIWIMRYHVIYHVHVAEFKETAQVPIPTFSLYKIFKLFQRE